MRLTDAVARQYARLLAVKDEYEVARLYTDGEFARTLASQFERFDGVHFHMAPPLFARRGPDGKPRKIRIGKWLMPVLKLMAGARAVRGSWIDPFGHTEERRIERQLARDYEATIIELLGSLNNDNRDLAVTIALVPERIRGYGHVKLANVASERAREKGLLERWRAGPSPAAAAREAASSVPAAG